MLIKENYIVKKSNVLNEFRSQNMTLEEIRFFSIYLSKINSDDLSTRKVTFPLESFKKIMNLERVKIDYIESVAEKLLTKVVKVRLEKGFEAFQLFKKFKLKQNEKSEWYVEIDAHDDALPLMFEFKDKYFTYRLWNALRLKSVNQIRMYEILKQYEKIGERIIDIDDLKLWLGLELTEYARFGDFKIRVLDACQEALEKNTDIKFTYEPHGKRGQGGKIFELKFKIEKNENYIDPLALDEFIKLTDIIESEIDISDETEINFENKRLEFLAEACDNEFSETEIQVLYNLLTQIVLTKVGETIQEYQIRCYNQLKYQYDNLNMQADKKTIKRRFGYIKKVIESEIKKLNAKNSVE